MNDWIGQTLSKVRIERMIGRGGMADVYVGRHITLDRPMAVKILHTHMTTDSDLRRRFEEEAKAVSNLRHPNIVQVYDFDTHQDNPYIVMELVDGMSLQAYLKELHKQGNALPLNTIVRLISGIASALDYAHARQIVHRDVKPANILLRKGQGPLQPPLPLGDDVQPTLTDFGVARIATAATQTASGTVLGTPAYMSPEQVKGERVDRRSDIYSLGVILYEMLAGKLPFDPEVDTPASILYKHVHEPPPPLPNIPGNVGQVANKALTKDKDQRYQKAGAFAKELGDAVAQPGAAAPVTAAAAPPSTAESPTGVAPGAGIPATPQPTTPSGVPAPPPTAETPVTPGPTVVSNGRGLSGMALVAAFALGAVALAGGVFVGVTLLRGAAEEPEPTQEATTLPADTQVPGALPTEAPAVTGAPPTPDLTIARGPVLGSDTALRGTVNQVPAPVQGGEYQAWLIGEGVEPLHLSALGSVTLTNDRLSIEFNSSDQSNLLAHRPRLEITLGGASFDPAERVYTGALARETVARLRLMEQVYPDTGALANLLPRLDNQMTHFHSHANLALGEISDGNLPGAKLHSEHTINISEGRAGELFGDWDGNGNPQNPGDDVGLLNYLGLLEEAARGFARAQELAGRIDDLPVRIADEAARLAMQTEVVREAARQVALADEMGTVQDLGLDEQLATVDQLRTDVDQLLIDAAALELTLFFEMFAVRS